MNKVIVYIYMFVFSYPMLVAQSLHTPSDMEQIIEKSKIEYKFHSEVKAIEPIKYPLIERISNQLFEVEEETVEKYHKKAKRAIERKDFNKAESYLTKASTVDVTNMVIRQSLAGVYVENKKYELALDLYKRILALNPFDYEIHQQIALCYQKLEEVDLSLRHITLAHLYNRNHEEISATMKSIYLENGYLFLNWQLNPEFQINSNKDSSVINIAFKRVPWGAYAKCKAVWDYEKGYADKMKFLSEQNLKLVEEKECLLNAVIAYEHLEDEKEKKQYPELEGLGIALGSKMVDEYIFYERILRENPALILETTPEEREKLVQYIQKIHTFSLVQ